MVTVKNRNAAHNAAEQKRNADLQDLQYGSVPVAVIVLSQKEQFTTVIVYK